MSVRDYCRGMPHTARAGDSLRDAAARMDSLGVGCLVVIDDARRPIGMLTDRDVALRVLRSRLDPDAVTIGDVMHASVVTVTEKAPVAVAIRFMRNNGLRRIPVVDPTRGEIRGLLTCDDLLPLLSSELTAAANVVRAQSPPGLRGEYTPASPIGGR